MSAIRNIDGPKDFIFRVLSGVAIGIVAGLVPNAILGEIFKYFMQYHPIFKTLLESYKPSNLLYQRLLVRLSQ